MSAGSIILAILCASLGQTPNDVLFSNQRHQEIPSSFPQDRKAEIREMLLYASQDQGQNWAQVARSTPDQSKFLFNAPVDGTYWLRAAVVDKSGRQYPENLRDGPPNLKMVIDTLKPLVKLSPATRSNNEIAVSWEIREDNPDWTTFRVEYQAPNGPVVPVNATPGLTGQARFTPNTNGPITVRLAMRDKASNETIVSQDAPGLDSVVTAGFNPPALPNTISMPPSIGGAAKAPEVPAFDTSTLPTVPDPWVTIRP